MFLRSPRTLAAATLLLSVVACGSNDDSSLRGTDAGVGAAAGTTGGGGSGAIAGSSGTAGVPGMAGAGGGAGASGAAGASTAVAQVLVTPDQQVLHEGAVLQFTVTVLDQNGNPIWGQTVVWGSANAAVASVSATGLVEAIAPGNSTITASVGAVSGQATLTVDLAVLLAAGDIADCTSDGDEATAVLLGNLTGNILALGDLAYPNGSAQDFANCYGPSWGKYKSRTYPVAGNHEYNTPGAAPYYAYFGAAAGDPSKGYYSFDYGAWHVVVLNNYVPMAAGSTQEQWLRADLKAHPNTCTLGLWHEPLYSGAQLLAPSTKVRPLFQALYDGGADLNLVGHAHFYERYAPQNADGAADPSSGVRQITVGTGGKILVNPQPVGSNPGNRQAASASSAGILKLTLHKAGYDWEFVPAAPGNFTDSGSDTCH